MREMERLRQLSRELLVLSLTGDTPQARWAADRMLVALDERHVPAGGSVYEAGTMPEHIFFMRAGEVEIGRPGGPSFRLANRWVFGSLDVLRARRYRLGAVARTDLDLVTVQADRWLEVLEDSVELAQTYLVRAAAGVAALHDRLPDGGFPAPAPGRTPLPRRPLNSFERAVTLGETPLLASASTRALASLARSASELAVREGERLLEPGRLYLVLEGLVEARRARPDIAARFGTGQLVGGALGLSEAWEARTVAPTRLLALTVEDLLAEIEEHLDLFRSAAGALADEREDLLLGLAARGPLVLP